jgi:hypothetical protein
MDDRGVLARGMKADLNLINLQVNSPSTTPYSS